MTTHADYHFSITCQTDDEAVLCCLRALAQHAETATKKQIGWGGTGADYWSSNNQRVTFRFTSAKCRDEFINQSNRLFYGKWHVVSQSDTDPAQPQR